MPFSKILLITLYPITQKTQKNNSLIYFKLKITHLFQVEEM